MGLREMAEQGERGERAETAPEGALPPRPDPQWVAMDPDVEAGLRQSIAAPDDAPVHVAWQRVMDDVWWLGKERREQSGKYMYRGIDDVVNLVGPALRKHGVSVFPVGATPTYTIINTAKGAAMNYCRIVSRFQVFGPRGDSIIGEAPGEAFDSGDKAATKAQSVAFRTFLIQALALMTNRPQLDTEYGEQHELAGPKKPTATEYAAEILDEKTSIKRLSQIKMELDGDRAMATTEVELAGGEKIQLAYLVRKEGRKRQEMP